MDEAYGAITVKELVFGEKTMPSGAKAGTMVYSGSNLYVCVGAGLVKKVTIA
jgi:hypothetical protein